MPFEEKSRPFWTDEFARQGGQYVESDTVLFTGAGSGDVDACDNP